MKRIAIVLLFIATSVAAQNLDQMIDREMPSLLTTYKQLHAAPELSIRVDNRLSEDGSQLSVPLAFRNLDDFSPAKVAEQVAPLKELLEMRKRLDEVLGKIEANVKLEGLLQEVLSNDEKVKSLAHQMGIDTSAPDQEKA